MLLLLPPSVPKHPIMLVSASSATDAAVMALHPSTLAQIGGGQSRRQQQQQLLLVQEAGEVEEDEGEEGQITSVCGFREDGLEGALVVAAATVSMDGEEEMRVAHRLLFYSPQAAAPKRISLPDGVEVLAVSAGFVFFATAPTAASETTTKGKKSKKKQDMQVQQQQQQQLHYVSTLDSLLNDTSADLDTIQSNAIFSVPARRRPSFFAASESLIVIVYPESTRDSDDSKKSELILVFDRRNQKVFTLKNPASILPFFHYGQGGKARVSCIDVHPTLPQLLIGTTRGEVIFFNDVRNRNPTILHWHAHKVESVHFFGTSSFLSGGTESVLVIWHLGTLEKAFLPRLGGDGIAHISSHEQNIYVLLNSSEVLLVDSFSWAVSRRSPPFPRNPNPVCHVTAYPEVVPIRYNPDGRSIVLYFPDGRALDVSQRMPISSAKKRPKLAFIASSSAQPTKKGQAATSILATVDVTPSNEFSACGEASLKFWFNLGELSSTVIERDISALAGAREAPFFVTGHKTGEIKLWNILPAASTMQSNLFGCVAGGKHLPDIPISSIAISHDGSCIACLTSHDVVELWRVALDESSLHLVHSFSIPPIPASLNSAAPRARSLFFFGIQGEKLVCLNGTRLVVFDLVSFQAILEMSQVLTVSSNQADAMVVFMLTTETSSDDKDAADDDSDKDKLLFASVVWLNQNLNPILVNAPLKESELPLSGGSFQLWLTGRNSALLQFEQSRLETRTRRRQLIFYCHQQTEDIVSIDVQGLKSDQVQAAEKRARVIEGLTDADNMAKKRKMTTIHSLSSSSSAVLASANAIDVPSHELPPLDSIFTSLLNAKAVDIASASGGASKKDIHSFPLSLESSASSPPKASTLAQMKDLLEKEKEFEEELEKMIRETSS